MARKENRQQLWLVCTECNNRNMTTTKNVKTTTDKLELKKYCPQKQCQKHTIHKEAKINSGKK